MKPKKRQKLCHNCEGGIDLDVIVCPYCAADLRIEKALQPKTLAPPIYSQALENQEEEIQSNISQPSDSTTIPHLFFAFGSQLFMLGTLLLFFSHEGALTLKLNARYWIFYIAASLPLLIFGYRSLFKAS